MLAVAGALADGVLLNWASPERIAWSRERIGAAATAAGREPGDVKTLQYLRVCVAEDEPAAGRALALAMLFYALPPQGAEASRDYRRHFARMGFAPGLDDLARMRAAGVNDCELADRVPDEMLSRYGYWGRPSGAAERIRALGKDLDTAIVRVVTVGGDDPASVRMAMRACIGESATRLR